MALVAGPLRLDYDAGDIRCIRLGDEEILRRVYVVFQDRNWTSRPWRIQQEEIVDRGDSFDITLRAQGTFDAEPFTWEATIIGDPDGRLTYTMRGEAAAPFLRNRLGICVLHPMAGYEGRACAITHPDGTTTHSAFPESIAPHQPFVDIVGMEWPVPGGRARLDFTGDVFETEDHRNWGDASYKTYCTPISRPFPIEVLPDDAIRQSATLTMIGVPLLPPPQSAKDPVAISVIDDPRPLPSIGTHLTPVPWTDAECADLRALSLGHVHADIRLDAPDATERIQDVVERARRLDARLLLALHVTDQPPTDGVATALAAASDVIDGVWIVHPEQKVTARSTTDSWRSRLGPHLPWGCGTNLYFTELNRHPPDSSGLAWTTFSVNPQVHASDDRTVMQNTAALSVIAREVPRLAGDTRIHVGPVTLKPRFNPNATEPDSDVSSTDLPADVDARQSSWFAAAWVARAGRALSAPATVTAVTLFDDLGWKGLRCRDTGPEDPAFAASPAARFPAYDVIQALAGATHVLPSQSLDPERVDAVVIDGPNGLQAIAVNLTETPRQVHLTGAVDTVIDLGPHDVRLLDLPGRAT
jgi:hypothetical protein